MKTRILTGAIALVLFIPFLIFSEGFLWNVAIAVISGICVFEILCCIKMLDLWALSIPALIYSVALPLICTSDASLGNAALVFLFIMFVIGVLSRNRFHTSQITLVAALTLFLTNALSGLILLRHRSAEYGLLLVILALLCAWGSDTGAYFSGRVFGTRRLAPELSPKKTVEGSIGSLITSVVLCILFGLLCNTFGWGNANLLLLAVTGAFANVFAQLGDLIASLFKRHYSIKDFGSIFPGHGGMLDRFDSVIGVSILLTVMTSHPGFFELFTPAL